MIVKNGNMVATVWAESIPYWATASNVAVLSLEKGDQVRHPFEFSLNAFTEFVEFSDNSVTKILLF